MPIAALPQSTARAIGSTSALSDACAVVKELLDNALDAAATSVSVEISQNTVDVIQVKDNGHGILPADYEFVCRRAYTSKIQTLDDLKNVGGQSLGFRGIALASVAEMASSLTVSTRAKSQIVGALLKYDRKGDLISQEKTSHPVGTTICVTGFLKYIPVRRQTALKSSFKTLAKIKKLLQSYGIAKPSTRLSLKVLRSKNESNNWVYAPSLSSSVSDAAMRVVGAEVASQCICKEWPSVTSTVPGEAAPSFKLVAFLPKADADFTKVGSSGQFLSVDERPLASSRGISKDIITLYKSYIRSAVKACQPTASLSDPILCLHISCPKGSYDANIEPAKDDVLFADPEAIKSLSESMFKDVYGSRGPSSQDNAEKESAPVNDNFNLLMARGPAVQLPVSPPPTNVQLPGTQMSFVNPDIEPTERTPNSILNQSSREMESSSEAESDSRLSDSNSMNPWTLAKTHFFRSSKSNSNIQLLTPIRSGQQGIDRSADNNRRISTSPVLPSPSYLSSRMSSPAEAHTSKPIRSSSHTSRADKSVPRLTPSKAAARQHDRERYGNGALDTWFQNTTQRTLNYPSSISPTTNESLQPADSDGAESVMLDDIDDVDGIVQPSRSIQKPFKLPLAPTSVRSSDIFTEQLSDNEGPNSGTKRQEFPVMEDWSSRLHQAPSYSNDSDIEEALDFERRKRSAILARREQIKNGKESITATNSRPTSKSPHQNRYLAAKAALTAGTSTNATQVDVLQPAVPPAASSPTTSLDRNDPRAHLMHYLELQRSTSVSESGIKPKRTNTNRLPLERIPDGFNIHDLALPCTLSLDQLAVSSRQLVTVDSYALSGNAYEEAFSSSDLDRISKLWESTLATLLQNKRRKVDGDGAPDIQLDILAAIQSSH